MTLVFFFKVVVRDVQLFNPSPVPARSRFNLCFDLPPILSVLPHAIDRHGYKQVAVKFFHRTDDDAASSRINVELITCIRLNHGLHSVYIDEDDARDLRHLSRLRDILVDAPILGDCGEGDFAPSTFRATALVFDWADGGDAHSWVRTQGGVTPAEGARLFRQVMRGLRALHRRGIVHRDIKVCGRMPPASRQSDTNCICLLCTELSRGLRV